MYLELLQEQVKWWNTIIVDLYPENKLDRIKIQYIEDNKPIDDLDLGLVQIDKRISYCIRLLSETDLFHKVEIMLVNISRPQAFEIVSKHLIEETIRAGFNNNIYFIRNLHLEKKIK